MTFSNSYRIFQNHKTTGHLAQGQKHYFNGAAIISPVLSEKLPVQVSCKIVPTAHLLKLSSVIQITQVENIGGSTQENSNMWTLRATYCVYCA